MRGCACGAAVPVRRPQPLAQRQAAAQHRLHGHRGPAGAGPAAGAGAGAAGGGVRGGAAACARCVRICSRRSHSTGGTCSVAPMYCDALPALDLPGSCTRKNALLTILLAHHPRRQRSAVAHLPPRWGVRPRRRGPPLRRRFVDPPAHPVGPRGRAAGAPGTRSRRCRRRGCCRCCCCASGGGQPAHPARHRGVAVAGAAALGGAAAAARVLLGEERRPVGQAGSCQVSSLCTSF